MGRIAYLTKRGKIWWYRRRHPAIVIDMAQGHDFRIENGPRRSTFQAKGHLSVSLGTTSAREARILAARLGTLFELEWAKYEQSISQMDERPQQDLIESLAETLAANARQLIGHYRATEVARLSPQVREKAFARVDAELRQSLGIAPSMFPDLFNRTLPAPILGITYEVDDLVYKDMFPEEHALQQESDRLYQEYLEYIEEFGPGEDGRPHLPAPQVEIVPLVAQNKGGTDDAATGVTDDSTQTIHLEETVDAVERVIKQLLETCERESRPLKTAFPGAERIAKSLFETALRLGHTPEQTPQGTTAPGQPVYNQEPLSKFAETYLKLRSEGYTLRRQDETPHPDSGKKFIRSSLANYRSTIKLFIDLIGDLPIGEIGRDEVLEFNDLIQRLPKHHGKSSQDQRPARQVIEDADEQDAVIETELPDKLAEKGMAPGDIEDKVAEALIQRISATTVQRHQTALRAMFEYAFACRYVETNPFKGRVLTDAEVKRRKRSERRIERKGWGDNIYALFKSPIYQETLEDVGEPLFWAPLIAVYAGLRLEEICQLRVNDFLREDGIPYIAVQNEIGSQTYKSENAIRKIPLHKALIDLDLPKLVSLRRQSKSSRLFPDLPRSKSNNTLSGIMSKRFHHYRQSRGLYAPAQDFHALRTEFQTRLTRQRVPDHVRRGLMGHEQADVTHEHYFRAGETMASLKEYIDRIDIDHSNINPPFGRALANRSLRLKVVASRTT
ncbi:MAG: Phage integrase family [Roseibaca calidilacus]|uniref:Phage integrase family n=1 Tax=Roseibaca calidilacus TaxID=1666912 RepID=A0A0P7YTU4_9RHOB|nr:site-specific integrase [Roseibaca calidilacus]KPP92804.1 MAG: Phage integrase family [Roseibaca calidilacus]CUX80124.1 Phage integrase family protein [Roseibaca calidilacus]